MFTCVFQIPVELPSLHAHSIRAYYLASESGYQATGLWGAGEGQNTERVTAYPIHPTLPICMQQSPTCIIEILWVFQAVMESPLGLCHAFALDDAKS